MLTKLLKAGGWQSEAKLWLWQLRPAAAAHSSQFGFSSCVMRDASRARLVLAMRIWRGHQEIQALDDSLSEIDVLAARSSLSPARLSRMHARLAHSLPPSRARSLPAPRCLAIRSARSSLRASSSLTHSCPSSRVHSSLPGSTLRTTRLRTTTRLPLHSEHPGPPSRRGVGFPRAERSHQPRGPGWRSGGSVGEQHGAAEQRGEQGSGGEEGSTRRGETMNADATG